MRFVLLIMMFLGITYCSFGQSQVHNLQTKLAYCKSEAERLEAKVTRYSDLMDMQNKEIIQLKEQIMELRDKVVRIEEEKKRLEEVALNMLYLAQRFEEDGNLEAALKMYKLLISTYPTSLEATSSRIKVSELQPKKKK